MKNNSVLITGGSGFLGSYLIPHLESDGYSLKILSREKKTSLAYLWDIKKRTVDPDALNGVGTIIHLAGANIAGQRWTNSYKKEIVESRVGTANLLFETLKNIKHNVRLIISISGINVYGDTKGNWAEEDFHYGESFLGNTCKSWEESALQFEKLGIRAVVFRTGIVLGKDGGALPALTMPIRFFAGAPFGTGKQYISWIHIHDLCRMFSFAIKNENLHGIYNAVAPGPVMNEEFTKMIAKTIHRPVWPIHIGSWLMKMILGESACIVLDGQRVSSEKIRMAGFQYLHSDLGKTLNELL